MIKNIGFEKLFAWFFEGSGTKVINSGLRPLTFAYWNGRYCYWIMLMFPYGLIILRGY
jgi:hypothetical protein